ncbi:MAG: hypothetical protein R6X33_10345 [Candidatus Brocadiia bacterium]
MRTTQTSSRVPGMPRGGRDGGRRGVALLIAIGVLAAMFLMAVPFAVFMRMQHSAGTQGMQTAQARYGEAGALNHARSVLYQGYGPVEQQRQDDFDDGDIDDPFPFGNPEMDSLWEFRVTLRTTLTSALGEADTDFEVERALGFPNDGDPETVDGYIRVDEEWMAYSHIEDLGDEDPTNPDEPGPSFPGGRLTVRAEHRGLFGTEARAHPEGSVLSFFPREELWHLDIKDQQARININTAPYRTLVNLLGYVGIGPDPSDAEFPSERQRLIASAIAAFKTNYSYWIDEDEPGYTPFQNVDMLKSISLAQSGGVSVWEAQGIDPLTADEIDLLLPYITVNSQFWEGAVLWRSAGSLASDIESTPSPPPFSTSRYAAHLDDASVAAVGSVLRFTWEDAAGDTHREYRLIRAKSGEDTQLASPVGASEETIELDWVPGFVGATDQTPGYVRVEDEWIRYTEAEPDDTAAPTILTLTLEDSNDRGVFGTTAADHAAGTTVHGNVVSWEHTAGLGQPLERDYTTAEPPVIQVSNRHYVNINTVDNFVVLRSLMTGLSDGLVELGDDDALVVARCLLSRTSDETYTTVTSPYDPPYSFFDGDEGWFTDRADLNDFIDTLPFAEDEAARRQILRDNFDVSQPGSWPAVATMPIGFNSGTLIGIDSVGSVDDRAGTPVAQSPRSDGLRLARIYDVVPPLEPIWWMLRTQREFHEHIQAGDSTNVASLILNTDLSDQLLADDPDERYTSRDEGVGTFSALTETFPVTPYTTLRQGLNALAAPDYVLNLDFARGDADEVNGEEADSENTTQWGFTDVSLEYNTDFDNADPAQRNIQADSFHATVQPLAIECWIKMPENGMAPDSEEFILDMGAGQTGLGAVNQLRLSMRYASGDRPRLILRMDDETGDGFVLAASSDRFQFADGNWHHIAVAATGTFRSQMAMFIDGIYDRDMDWRYVHGAGAEDEGSVDEGYLWPVAMDVPDAQYFLADDYEENDSTIRIEGPDPDLLPPQGMVVLDSPADAGNIYEYTRQGNELALIPSLTRDYPDDDSVASLIPVRRPWAEGPEPAAGDSIIVVGHDRLAGTDLNDFSFEPDGRSGAVTIDRIASPTQAPLDDFEYRWLAIDPSQFPLLDDDDTLGVLNRAKVLFDDPATLTGALPCWADEDFRIGDDASNIIIDQLRITALPTAFVRGGADEDDATIDLAEWEWGLDADLDNWPRVMEKDGATHLLAEAQGEPPLQPDGGFFLAEGELYSYFSYNNNPATPTYGRISGIERVNDDLTPEGDSGLRSAVDELRRVLPLNFIGATRLVNDFSGGDIDVESARWLPSRGYVKIDEEIIGYKRRETGVAPDPDLLVREENIEGVSAYPRGAYGTEAAGHDSGTIVRHLPVRFPDRYRVDDDSTPPTEWDNHVDYDDNPQLNLDMCMLECTIPLSGQLRTVMWELKEPLEDDQKLIVLLRLDPALDWSTHPQDWGTDARISEDGLWGVIAEDDGTGDVTRGGLSVYQRDPVSGELSRPSIPAGGVELRFYLDIGESTAYRHSYDPTGDTVTPDGEYRMLQVDTVGVELVPESMTY